MSTTQTQTLPKPPGSRGPGRGGWDNGGSGGPVGGGPFPVPTARLGLWLLIAVGSVLFFALVSAYIVRSGLEDWQPLPEPGVLWVNTALLALASVTLQRGVQRLRVGEVAGARRLVWASGVQGLAFVAGQLLAWSQLLALGYGAAANPANTFFYLITALHGAHMLGGLGAWVHSVRAVHRRGAGAELGLSLCTTYWHFLLGVWLVLFAMMWFT